MLINAHSTVTKLKKSSINRKFVAAIVAICTLIPASVVSHYVLNFVFLFYINSNLHERFQIFYLFNRCHVASGRMIRQWSLN